MPAAWQGDGHRRRRHDRDAVDAEGSVRRRHRARSCRRRPTRPWPTPRKRPGRARMPGEAVYESPLPWAPERPDTTIITCVDGRWYPHFQEFARQHLRAGQRTDFLAVPGGIEPMTLFDLVPKDFNFFRRRLEGLVERARHVADRGDRAPGLRLVQDAPNRSGDREPPRSPDCRPPPRGRPAPHHVRARQRRNILCPAERLGPAPGGIRRRLIATWPAGDPRPGRPEVAADILII